MKQSEPNETSRDLIAFILLCLERITETVEESAEAWEKPRILVKSRPFSNGMGVGAFVGGTDPSECTDRKLQQNNSRSH
jgi:hypothetical protein